MTDAGGPEGRTSRHLDAEGLRGLEAGFRSWAGRGRGPATRRARGRVLLVCLLLRHTGARLGEVLGLHDRRDLDLDRGAVRFADGREAALPAPLVRELAVWFADPENAALRPGSFRLDQGHVRRKFQEVGAALGLDGDLRNPSVLRRSRAVELFREGASLEEVRRLLGYGSVQAAAGLLEAAGAEARRAVNLRMQREKRRTTSARNTFFGRVSAVRRGDIQSEVEMVSLGGHRIASVITNGSLESLGLGRNRYVTAMVKAPFVVLAAAEAPPPSGMGNVLEGVVARINAGEVAAEVVVELSDGLEVCALLSRASLGEMGLAMGQAARVAFSPLSVILTVDEDGGPR